jgi:molybdopterin-guanine dinucleotide biosynthesis protein MobB
MIDFPCPVVGFCAFSGTGKTTLLTRLIPLLKAEGLRLGLVKHAHHGFELDQPGKDSYELRKAGADQTVVTSRRRMASIIEFRDERPEPGLAEALTAFRSELLDLVLVEGFKHERFPRIELHRASLGKPLIYPDDPDVIAIATDVPMDTGPDGPPWLDLNRPNEIVRFILERFALSNRV